MDFGPPPPPPLLPAIPQFNTNDGTTSNGAVSNHHHHHSSSPESSVLILIIGITSVIIVSAAAYFLIRFFSHSNASNGVVLENRNVNEHVRHHEISIHSNEFDWLPVFTYSSITGNKSSGGDCECAICLTKFEANDQLRRLPLCCHAFHVECIDPWLKSNYTCPLCRSTINPSEADIMNLTAASGEGNGNRSNSLRIEIGIISQRRDPSESDRMSYSVGSYEYVVDDSYEIPVELTHRRAVSVDKDEPPVEELTAEIAGGGNRNWLREYVDRLSSRTLSFRDSGRFFFTGSSRRSETMDDYEATHGRIGEEISEYFRWLSGV